VRTTYFLAVLDTSAPAHRLGGKIVEALGDKEASLRQNVQGLMDFRFLNPVRDIGRVPSEKMRTLRLWL